MPHSPRWYGDRLWLLQSGTGDWRGRSAVGRLPTGRLELPGFTRGLDFCGPLAFIGLSQVRETAIFSGLAITERPAERHCGVWIVNIHTGQVIAFLRFEDSVQEIFAIQVLPGRLFPDLLNDHPRVIAESFVLPDESLADVPATLLKRVVLMARQNCFLLLFYGGEENRQKFLGKKAEFYPTGW